MKVIKHKDKWYLQSETGYKEILLSTDDSLIKDGVQAIDDEFLEWFVKNPSCEEVELETFEVEDYVGFAGHTGYPTFHNEYKIIIPKKEPTLTNICIKCGVDLHNTTEFICQEHPKNCKGIHINEETLQEWANKEKPKQELRKVCKCKRAYENPLSEICSLCWNELYPNEKDEIKDEDLLEPKQETFVNEKCFKCGRSQYSSGKPFCTDDFCNKNFYQKPKQETLEEAAEKEFPLMDIKWCRTGACEEENFQLLGHRRSFIKGVKWQQERSYSEKEVIKIVEKSRETGLTAEFLLLTEQFKKR